MKLLNLFALGAFLLVSCGKEDGRDIVDCVGESLLAKVHAVVDAPNPKMYDFSVSYSGSHTLKAAIRWDYGDGTVETVNGTFTTHTYKTAGTYTVKASVSLVNPDCTFDLKHNITVQ